MRGGRRTLFVAALLSGCCSLPLAADELQDRMDYWRSEAFRCSAPDGPFPSGAPEVGSEFCADGDMNLFAGLLCAVGEEEGCDAVRRSQNLDTAVPDNLGRWFRSPRRLANDNDADEDGRRDEDENGIDLDGDGRTTDIEWNRFSFDMAIGSMLYLVSTNDRSAGQQWWDWIVAYTPCMSADPGDTEHCKIQGDPRLCAPPDTTPAYAIDKKVACSLRPVLIVDELISQLPYRWAINWLMGSDYAVMVAVNDHLGLESAGAFRERLDDIRGQTGTKLVAAARMNDEGFSEHLVAATILLLRKIGRESQASETAAKIINCKKPEGVLRPFWDWEVNCAPKQPENAFYRYLRDGATGQVIDLVLDTCPSPERPATEPSYWIWESTGNNLSGRRSMYWDCIFMGRLLGAH